MEKSKFDMFLKKSNLTRKDFAYLTGIKYPTVGKWNNDTRPIPSWVESWLQNYIKAKNIDKIAEAVKPYIKDK